MIFQVLWRVISCGSEWCCRKIADLSNYWKELVHLVGLPDMHQLLFSQKGD